MPDIPDPLEPEAIVAGTLCLMSCPNSSGTPVYVRRIVANLERLAMHSGVTIEMRTVCRRLAAQWEQRLADCRDGHGSSPVH